MRPGPRPFTTNHICFPMNNKIECNVAASKKTRAAIIPILLVLVMFSNCYAQKSCEALLGSEQYYSASATASTEKEARINALSSLVENISSIVSSTTNMTTKDDQQTYYNVSKTSSVLRLKGVSYQTCNKTKKGWTTVVASISKKDLEQSSVEVAARVRQYMELMEQKEATNEDFLPEAYTAYLHTFLSPYAIEYNSASRRIGNVRDYLASYFRAYLSNINVSFSGVRENPEYPDQQLTFSLALEGTKETRMRFQIDLPGYGARGNFDRMDNQMDVIMAPEGRRTKFTGTLTLTPPPVESELKDISDQVRISRDISFEADLSSVIALDFTTRRQGDEYLLTPVARHLSIRQFEWLSDGKVVSTEQMPHIPIALKEITLRVNGSNDLVITKPLDGNGLTLSSPLLSQSLTVEALQTSSNLVREASEMLVDAGFPDDAVVFVMSDVPGLTFRSSMTAIDRQRYNSYAGRYEIFTKAVKQLLSVESGGIEKSMGIVNPQPKEAICFLVNGALTGQSNTDDAVSYLRPRTYHYYLETETDPLKLAAQKKAADYRRQKANLQAKAAIYYSTGALFIGMGAYYHWIDRMISDQPGTLAKFGNASYVIGGAGIVAGIIYSVKGSHLKKNWSIEPAPNTPGLGIAYRFK